MLRELYIRVYAWIARKRMLEALDDYMFGVCLARVANDPVELGYLLNRATVMQRLMATKLLEEGSINP